MVGVKEIIFTCVIYYITFYGNDWKQSLSIKTGFFKSMIIKMKGAGGGLNLSMKKLEEIVNIHNIEMDC